MKKKHIDYNVLLMALAIVGLFSCSTSEPTDLTKVAIIPQPVSVTADGSAFELSDKTVLYAPEGSEPIAQVGRYLAENVTQATGFNIRVEPTTDTPAKGIYLTLAADSELGEEGYQLTINKKKMTLTANSPQGLFRGTQTIRQLLPATPAASSGQSKSLRIAGGYHSRLSRIFLPRDNARCSAPLFQR
ncbi:glycoside hydrolase family 20 zincin-like fold domain-containing protein [Gaoshiqia sediminis]|uniref:Glycoside hydrolase family 20 zincin-like fold domain-containing protein n=1 Tax=Gaoshiqia sediminis TaxID=2986998 RepID=A0AA42C3Z3_9BACT|nr:glycoside hydrolase family 20 zincin-like fold domain-containing protein [Gaoshiqia sediminis]MCW0481233.1 glycoside hydrolase family 20 zincin-like fold domain-containing protein [Gaoshiqia sediminis]